MRWKAIYAFGLTAAKIAKEEIERARILIRRLMWMLNEESGSMPWGVGEAFGEALYHEDVLRKEYLQIYVSYIWPKGNYLEFPPAQRGIIWGIGRLAQRYAEVLLKIKTQEYLVIHLNSPDEGVLFLTLWSLKNLSPWLDLSPYILLISKALEVIKTKGTTLLLFDGISIRSYTFLELQDYYQKIIK